MSYAVLLPRDPLEVCWEALADVANQWWLRWKNLGRAVAVGFSVASSLVTAEAASKPALKSATYGQQVVAAVLMGEAWSEGEAGMTAVAEVIRARAAASELSPVAVVLKRYQFSCLNGVNPKKLIERFQKHPDFALALRISRRLYNAPERLPGIARGATHFEKTGTRAYWTRGLRPVVSIGLLDFYRVPNDG